ncbi:NHL domain-containing protein [Granulicella arctica]|uniref:NHL domain-containing protein n=1 Tax=Granulicella arctica TaxID=940613 RepID=UPI0021DFA8C1|nr:Ig-like domain repeat protein [Granulicella arctica]
MRLTILRRLAQYSGSILVPVQATLSVMLLALLAPTVSAQSTPAAQYVPMVTTYAGGAVVPLCSGATDTYGDGCVSTQTILNGPTTGEADAAGNLYFADFGDNVIHRMDINTGVMTVVAGQLYATGATAPSVCATATDSLGDGCLATQAVFNAPRCVRFDRDGDMVIADVVNQVIRRVDHTTGIITVLMGQPGTAKRIVPNNAKPTTPLTTSLDNPYIFMFDPAGNMFVSNSTGDTVLMAAAINGVIDPNNSEVYGVAGTGAAAASPAADGNGGLATSSKLLTPRGLALDSAENVYIGDYGDEQVRQVTSPGANGQFTLANINAGLITNLVGTGTVGTTGDGGIGTSAETASPQGLGFDNAGTLYIEQYSSGNDYIRNFNILTGVVNAFAGTGAASETGDGGPAATATFFTPTGIKANIGGRLTVFDTSNNRVRNIYPTPFFEPVMVGTSASQNAELQAVAAFTPSTVRVTGKEFTLGTLSGCSLGAALSANAYCTIPLTFTPKGPGLRTAQLAVIDSNNSVYLDPVQGIGRAPAAAFYGAPITTIAGNGNPGNSGNGSAPASATVNAPQGGTFDGQGNYFFADTGNNVVREITTSTGNISVVAGNGSAGYGGDGSAATAGQLNGPTGVAVDAAGNLFISDSKNNRIREVSAATTLLSTIAGTGASGYAGDNGYAASATLNNPTGIALDNTGVLYVADTGNHALRAFSTHNGIVVTLAGTGRQGYAGDGSVPQLALLNAPSAVAIDLNGNIFVADTGNAVIRKVTPILAGIINFQGSISTYAGVTGGSSNSGDGGPAISADLLTPTGVATDAAGDLYIAAGNQVRMVAPSGTITTIAGRNGPGSYSGEGASAVAALIPGPAQSLAVDPIGNVYLSDTAGNRILSIAGSAAAAIPFGYQVINTASSPQSVTLYNPGNQTLALSSMSASTGYALSGSGAAACSTTTMLAAGASCVLTVTFTPSSLANSTGQITLTDNALNDPGSTQTVALSGTGVAHLNTTTTVVTYSPIAPVYGQTITLTATVTGPTTPTGTVSFVVNGRSATAVTLNANGQASLQIAPSTGAATITANYLGDMKNASSTGSVSFMVAPAVLTVTAANQSIYPTQALPALTYAITGFVSNDTVATTVTGTPILSTTETTASLAGSYPITVTQGTLAATNYSFSTVSGVLTLLPPMFSLSASPASLSIASGQVGSTTITLTPSPGYTGTVTLSCGTLPSDVICTFNASTIAVDPSGAQTTQLTISTNNRSEVASIGAMPHGGPVEIVLGVLSLFALPWAAKRRGVLSGITSLMLFAALFASITGCAPPSQKASSSTGSITITATDLTSRVARSAALGLTIQ